MANDLLNLVRDAHAKKLGGARNKSVLSYLADRAAKETDEAFPGDDRIAFETGWSRGTVIKAMNYLMFLGAIQETRPASAPLGRARVIKLNRQFLVSIERKYQRTPSIRSRMKRMRQKSMRTELAPIEDNVRLEPKHSDVQISSGMGSIQRHTHVQNSSNMGSGFAPQPILNLQSNHHVEPAAPPPSHRLTELFNELRNIERAVIEGKLVCRKGFEEADKTYGELFDFFGGTNEFWEINNEASRIVNGLDETLRKAAETAAAKWVRTGERGLWDVESLGPAPGQPGSKISAARLRDIRTEQGVSED